MGNRDVFVAKYDSAGNFITDSIWDSGTYDYGYDIAINGSSDIYITGYTDGMGAGGGDAFIAKFNSTLDSKKNITWGRSNHDQGQDIILDNSGNIYIIGRTIFPETDAFIAKFNSTLDSKMNITWHTDNTDSALGIALDDSGNIYITGYYSNPPNSIDVFIAKYDSEGRSKTNITWGGSQDDRAEDIAIDDSGSIYITGKTESHGNGAQAFIHKYSPVSAPVTAADDDDDDDDDVEFPTITVIIILASIGASIAVIYILIRKGVIGSSKVKR